jgi:hypothetical protein
LLNLETFWKMKERKKEGREGRRKEKRKEDK